MHSPPPFPSSDAFAVPLPIVKKQRSLVSLTSSSYSTGSPTPTSSSYCGHSRYDSIVMGASVSVQLDRFDANVSFARRKKKLSKPRVGNPRTSAKRGSAQAWPPIPFPPQPSTQRAPSIRSKRSSTIVEHSEELSRRLSLLELTVSPILGTTEEGLWGSVRDNRIPEEEEYEPQSALKRFAYTEPSSPKFGARSFARSIIGSVHSSVQSRSHSRSQSRAHSRSHSFTNSTTSPPPLPPTPTIQPQRHQHIHQQLLQHIHNHHGVANRRRSQLFAAPPATATRPQHIDLPPSTFETIPQSLAHLDLADDRPTTPASYTVLGMFKRGSLRITNGAASPVPSTTTGGRTPMCLTPTPFERPSSRALSSALSNRIDASVLSLTKAVEQALEPGVMDRPELEREDSYFAALGSVKRRNSTSTIGTRASSPFSFIEDANDEQFMITRTSAMDDGLFDNDDEHGPPRPEKEKDNEEWLNSEEYKLLRQQWRETLNQRAVTSRYHAAINTTRIPKQPSPHEELPPAIKISPPPPPPRKERFPDDPKYDEDARKATKSALRERIADAASTTRSKSSLLSLRPKSSSNSSINTERSERLFAIQKVQKHKRVPMDSATIDYHNVLLSQTQKTPMKATELSKQDSGDSGYHSAEQRAERRKRSNTLPGTPRLPRKNIDPEIRKSTPSSMNFRRDEERVVTPKFTVSEKQGETTMNPLNTRRSVIHTTPSTTTRGSFSPKFTGLRLNINAFRGGYYKKETACTKKAITTVATETREVEEEPVRVLGGYDREAVARWTDSIKQTVVEFPPEPKHAPPPPPLSAVSYYEPESPVSSVSPDSSTKYSLHSPSPTSPGSVSSTLNDYPPLPASSKSSPYSNGAEFPPAPNYAPPPPPSGGDVVKPCGYTNGQYFNSLRGGVVAETV